MTPKDFIKSIIETGFVMTDNLSGEQLVAIIYDIKTQFEYNYYNSVRLNERTGEILIVLDDLYEKLQGLAAIEKHEDDMGISIE